VPDGLGRTGDIAARTGDGFVPHLSSASSGSYDQVVTATELSRQVGHLEEGPPPSPERRRRVLRVTLAVVAVLALVLVGGAVAVVVSLDRNIERLEDPFAGLEGRPDPSTGTTPGTGSGADEGAGADGSAGDAVNILVLGTDSRISAGDPGQWERGAQRTDVMMLVHIPADASAGYVMSIPRDAWVDIPGHGEAKLNAAFSLGGPTLLIETFEQLTQVRVDHFAVTDFESFRAITDALGGVRITLREDLVHRGETVLPQGSHLMTGDQALIYVRQRMNLARGDFDRVQRQQAWMRSMVRRTTDREVLQDPAKWYPVLDAVTESVAVDPGLTRARMVELLMSVKDLRASDLSFFTVPIDGIGTSRDGQSIVLLNRPAFDDLMAALRSDELDTYLAENDHLVDRLPTNDP
jgi:LCP family protein required for cell wall assembly